MFNSRVKTAAIVLAASAGLAGCAYGPYGGVSVGAGYGNYGYGSYGYDPYYSGYGYGYGDPFSYYGWNNGYYYPGSGWYVYDRHRHRYPMTDAQKQFWRDRIDHWRQKHGTTSVARESWEGFSKQRATPSATATATGSAQADQQSLRTIREARRQAVTGQQQARSEARAARQQERQDSVREQRQERRHSKPDG